MRKSAIRRMWVILVTVLGMLALAAPTAWADTFTVNNTNDTGADSLRQAIIDANNAPGEDTIAFGPKVGATYPADTIGLRSALPQLSSVRIEGPGAHRLTVQIFSDIKTPPSFIGHIFNVGAGATVSIDGLTMSRGGGLKPDGSAGAINGGAIFNPATGTLKITNSTVSNSIAQRGSGIYNAGTLTIADSTICDNPIKLSGAAGVGLFNAGPVRRFLPELIDLIWNRKIDPGKVFDLTLPLEQVAEGYRAMDERRAIKTLLRP